LIPFYLATRSFQSKNTCEKHDIMLVMLSFLKKKHNLISTSIDNVISSILVDNNCKSIIDRYKD